ncbi:helix-turn-helix domain-containing protein [Amycolatopsis sp. H20-H5]|uniref:helix-turn-helix domain-containing protein n=1 Tax=Amycolatopsis sp. H20-H5 TaxID=3046309 RepID=UPI003FA36225
MTAGDRNAARARRGPPHPLRGRQRQRVATAIAARFRSGETVAELAAVLGRRHDTVLRLLTEAGIAFPVVLPPETTDEDTTRILAYWHRRGLSAETLVDQTGLSSRTIRRHLAAAGVAPSTSSVLSPRAAALAGRQYGKGSSIRQLAARFGCSYTTMHTALVAAGISLRPRGRRPSTCDQPPNTTVAT